MIKLRRLAIGILIFSGCARLASCSGSLFHSGGDWEIEKIEERWNGSESKEEKEDLITFRNGKTWENLGMKAEKIAVLGGPGGSRVLAFKALSCVECEPDLLLTIRSTASDKVVSELFPGKMTNVDIESGVRDAGPSTEVHAYFGKCLDGKETDVVILETISLPDGRTSFKLITPTATGLETTKIEELPSGIRTGNLPWGCAEIPQIDRDVEG